MKFVKGKYNNYRVAVVVSKKVAKSAPNRNRIRRRVYEAVRLNSELLTNQDIVITIFDDKFLKMPQKELLSSIKRQLKTIAQRSVVN
jgi:ribonuclease P protein component